jgi:hypothetical protein
MCAPKSARPEFGAKLLHLGRDLRGLTPLGSPRLKLPNHRRMKTDALI